MADLKHKAQSLWMILGWLASLVATQVSAQDIRLAQQRGPYYVDEPMMIQVQVNGLQPGKNVECKFSGDPRAGITIEGPQIGQSTNSFTQIINGQVSSSETVNMKFSFTVTSSQPGEFTVGPFTVNVEGRTKELDGVTLEFGQLEEDENMRLEVSLPREKFYVGEKVPVTIRWLYSGDRNGLQYAFSNLQIRSPLFDQFEFDDSPPSTRTTLSIATAQGIVEVDAEVTQEVRDGNDYFALTGSRTLIAGKAGTIDGIRVTSRTQRVTAWGRDFFGDPRPRSSQAALASSQPLKFEILPIPTANRPATFSGGVGRGFTIDVVTNRSVVRVGDPISLDVSLKGDGNLEQVALPPLASLLDSKQFQLPTETPAGVFSGNTKQFKVSVRVSDRAVNQLPALQFSWFDPQQEKFVSTSSKPIALQVTDAQIVSSRDVVSVRSQSDAREEQPEQSSSLAAANRSGVADRLEFLGANLAIERNVQTLMLSSSSPWMQSWIVPVAYLLGFASILLAVIVQRRGKRPAEQLKLRSLLKQCLADIRASESKPLKVASQQIAEALRRLIAAFPDCDRNLANSIIGECDGHHYAPTVVNGTEIQRDLVRRALIAAEQLAGK